MEAFKYCVERECNIVELDVRTSRDGKLVLLHDQGLERLTGTDIANVHLMDWDKIKDIDVGATHPNRKQFPDVRLCLLDEALDYLLANNVKVIIDVKGEDKQVVAGILNCFSTRPTLYQNAAVTCFNPFVLYQVCSFTIHVISTTSEIQYWRWLGVRCAGWCVNRPLEKLYWRGVLKAPYLANTLLGEPDVEKKTTEKDSYSNLDRPGPLVDKLLEPERKMSSEIQYWRWLGVRCAGWCVNRPLEKLYWRGVLKAPYLANTLLGEPDVEKKTTEKDSYSNLDRPGPLVDKLLEPERKMSSGQN
ncbi:hypothetical protein B5X24_HaOG209915 [Helicoverpa armigera]|uniref:GP-PDE domain-containing protein n=1 Tax=Helicoverpa armigera TaxID=29058 RepID=A0A2W1BND0_HELAM|nr:hypothetical protein B5X24_HaOG209915 [Helicoverpa armigera]